MGKSNKKMLLLSESQINQVKGFRGTRQWKNQKKSKKIAIFMKENS